MNAERLIHDANQIAQYFAAYPRDEAIDGIADHIRRFWDPRMRADLHSMLAANQAGLHPLVSEAAGKLTLR